MQIHELKREHKNKRDRIVGRGGKHAKTSGRGGKGQTARAGNKRRPEMRDIIKRLPKRRGYRFHSRKGEVLVERAKSAGTSGEPESFSAARKRTGLKGSKIRFK